MVTVLPDCATKIVSLPAVPVTSSSVKLVIQRCVTVTSDTEGLVGTVVMLLEDPAAAEPFCRTSPMEKMLYCVPLSATKRRV